MPAFGLFWMVFATLGSAHKHPPATPESKKSAPQRARRLRRRDPRSLEPKFELISLLSAQTFITPRCKSRL